MNLISVDDTAAWPLAIGLGTCFAAGVVIGTLYFRSLRWTTIRLASGGSVLATVLLTVGRFALLSGLLILASRKGAPPLLAMTLGVVLARFVAVRGFREVPP